MVDNLRSVSRFEPAQLGGIAPRLAALRPILSRPAIVTVLAVVLIFNVVIEIEAVQRAFPFIQWGQLKFHQFITALSPRSITPKWVKGVEIDDEGHRRFGDPTNRAMLAKLVSNSADGGASAVVLDIKLLAPDGMTTGEDDAARAFDNAALLDAVLDASKRGMPVILATWLEPAPDHEWVRMPNIYSDALLPLGAPDGGCPLSELGGSTTSQTIGDRHWPVCAGIGNINLPVDGRRIPLVTRTGNDGHTSDSLALAAVNAYEQAVDRRPRTREKHRVHKAILENELLFASFIPERDFQKIPALSLVANKDDAVRLVRGRILVVGGTWRQDLGRGEQIDAHDTPVGRMRGMYLHANYIEALLDDRYAAAVPLWLSLLFDFVVGAWLYIRYHHARDPLARLGLLIIPGGLLVTSYVVFANLNFYLDFILPLGACFVHLAVEYVRDLRSAARLPVPAGHRSGHAV